MQGMSVSFCQCVQMADEGFSQTGTCSKSLSLSFFTYICNYVLLYEVQYIESPFHFSNKKLLSPSFYPDTDCHSSKGKKGKEEKKFNSLLFTFVLSHLHLLSSQGRSLSEALLGTAY